MAGVIYFRESARAATDLLRCLDQGGFRAIYGVHASRAATEAMIVLTLSGGACRDVAVACSLAFARTRRIGGALAAVLAVSGIATTLLKYVVGRPRPAFALSDVHALWGPSATPSFPSGHTAATFAMAAFLVLLWKKRPPVRFGLAGSMALSMWAVAVGISRIFLGVHFPSDAVGGAGLGVLVGALGAKFYLRHSGDPRTEDRVVPEGPAQRART
ncbi:MAG TPA: phosphatase PAP2 family protein [Polyangiaceae bacterium]|nr:phosphatase PAP2 family protein [Polyangiaceae bacterium]